MFVLIASDSPSIATRARKALALHGHECPITHLVGLEQVGAALESTARPVEILMLVLPIDGERSLELIRRIRSLTTAQLIAVGSARNSKQILDALHAGADDYLDQDAELAEQLGASLERIQLRSETAASGRLVAVTAASGGSGCTTIAANLSVQLAQHGATCALLELVSGFGDQSALFNLTPRYTLADLLRNHESIDRGMLEQSLVTHSSGVQLLTAPSPFDDVDLSDAPAVGRIVGLIRSQFPWSVLDLDCRFGRNTEVLKSATVIIVTFRLDFTSLCNTRRLLEAWAARDIDPQRVLLVGNRVGQSAEVPIEQAQQLLGKSLDLQIPDDVLHANLAASCGNPVVLESPKSSLSRAVAQLSERLLGATAKHTSPAGDSGARQAAWQRNTVVKKVAGILFC